MDDDVSDEGEAVLGGGRAAIFEATERPRKQNDHFMGVKGTKKNDQKPTSMYRGGAGYNVKVSGARGDCRVMTESGGQVLVVKVDWEG